MTIGMPSCDNMMYYSMAFGALSNLVMIDQLLPAPPAIHWAAAGAAADYSCRGGPVFDKEYAMNMAYGYGGGFVMSMITGR